jgi:hypothetical protein
MKKRFVLCVLLPVILVAAALAVWTSLPVFVVLADPLYGETSLAQVRSELFFSLLKKGTRLKVVTLDKLPEDGDEDRRILNKAGGSWVLCTPAVTTAFSHQMTSWNGQMLIGMGKGGVKSPLFSVVLVSDDDEEYRKAAKAGKAVVLAYEGDAPEFSDEYVRVEKIREESDLYLATRMADWKAQGVDVVVTYKVRCLPLFFQKETDVPFSFVVPSIEALSLPVKKIAGLIVDDLASSISGFKSFQTGKPQLVLPLSRAFRPGAKMRGGLLRSEFEGLLRFFH